MRSRRALALAVCALVFPGTSQAFGPDGRAKIALDALRLAPPSLARQIQRHRQALIRGARVEPPAGSLPAAGTNLTNEVRSVIALIDTHKPFRRISEAMGRLAGIAATLNHPLWGSNGSGPALERIQFSEFFEDRMGRFPLVFGGYEPLAESVEGLSGFPGVIRARCAEDRARLIRAYHPPDGRPVAPEDFDDRSVPFAIASLAYSRAVTDTAQVWIAAWRGANADLSGTPYLTPTVIEELP